MGVVKHGMARTPEYKAFTQAKYRCENPNEPCYAYYGGRGIEFRFTGFAQFIGEIGPRPVGHSLDRIKTEGHYEPGNVRWATRIEQVLNRRSSYNSTGFKGVRRDKNRFSAQITLNYKNHYLGTYGTPEEAALAFDRAAIKFHGPDYKYINGIEAGTCQSR